MRVDNFFIGGKMDSDTHYSLVSNENYILAENMRIIGEGDDGSFKSLKGSEIVSDFSQNSTMEVLGMYEGANNKLFYFLAKPNGHSRIVEYDVETGVSRIIIEDFKVLLFYLIRWNNGSVIKPLKYLLSINQIGDLLIFSNEIWEYIRCVNLSRLSDYANGFTEEDITLAKKPPKLAPIIINKEHLGDIQDSDKSNVFISFFSRYKYKDGDFSSLSFASELAFEQDSPFNVDRDRMNTGMQNRYNSYTISVNSGGKNVTDIEVYAVEHGTNYAYLIYNVNKEKSNIADDVLISDIKYQFSKNYPTLSETLFNMLFSNVPKFPKAQTVAGRRLIFGNYKEGYNIDISGNVDFELRKQTTDYTNGENNPTAVSLITYKAVLIYADDYNVSSTGLLPLDQTKPELEVPFEDRFKQNTLEVKLYSDPPSWATKMKWAVKGELLAYEILYITYVERVGSKLYLSIKEDNVSRIKKDDTIIRVDDLADEYVEYRVKDVKEYTANDGVTVEGFYALIDVDAQFKIEDNGAENITKAYNEKGSTDSRRWFVIDSVKGSTDSRRFDSTSGYKGYGMEGKYYDSIHNRVHILKSDFGQIFEGDSIQITLSFKYVKDKRGRGSGFTPSDRGSIDVDKTMYASRNYNNIYELLVEQFEYSYFDISEEGVDKVWIATNRNYIDVVRDSGISAYTTQPSRTDIGRDERLLVNVFADIVITRGKKPIIFRTKNTSTANEFYFETPKTYLIQNGQPVADYYEGGKPVFEIGFHNGWTWGNGVESYKIKDSFTGNKYSNSFRSTTVELNGYKQIHRKTDITYSGVYNNDLGYNYLSTFNATEANWLELPIRYGEIQRLISLDGNLTSFHNNKVIDVFYGKSIIADMQGVDSVVLSKDVLGGYKELPYEYGISENPESAITAGNAIYFTDRNRRRFLLKGGNEIMELNAPRSGFHKEGVELLANNESLLGSYDDAHGEYIVTLNGTQSVAFNLTNKGFTTYYKYNADFIFGMNGKFFSAYKGVVYQNEISDTYNHFAGQPAPELKLVYVVNREVSMDKIFKALFLQSNTAWDVKFRTNLTHSLLTQDKFSKRDSFYYSDIPGDITDTYNIYGVGVIQDVSGNILSFNHVLTTEISVGDLLINDSNNTKTEITSIVGKTIGLSDATNYTNGDYVYVSRKRTSTYNPSGTMMRGKWMEVTITKTTNEEVYITSASTEIEKSYL